VPLDAIKGKSAPFLRGGKPAKQKALTNGDEAQCGNDAAHECPVRGSCDSERCAVRGQAASADDVDAVDGLAAELAQSFPFSRAKFRATCPAVLATDGACLLVAVMARSTWVTCSASSTRPFTRTGRWPGLRRSLSAAPTAAAAPAGPS
jgi:hypothetical protein